VGQVLHRGATTTEAVRRAIQHQRKLILQATRFGKLTYHRHPGSNGVVCATSVWPITQKRLGSGVRLAA
jgi:hypothetical protein